MMDVSDVIWGVDPDKLVSSFLPSGHAIALPKSRCSEPCDIGAVKVSLFRILKIFPSP